jgi:hypothetical protein
MKISLLAYGVLRNNLRPPGQAYARGEDTGANEHI